MKAKLIFTIFFITAIASGQEWSPIGAEWYYDITYAAHSTINYQRVFCDSIVNINGIDCKRINIDHCACNNHFCSKLHTYEQNDSIFFFNDDLGDFQLLYDFSAEPTENWEILTGGYGGQDFDTVVITVDSIGIEIVNDIPLRKLYVTYDYTFYPPNPFQVHSVIYEKLGDIDLVINIFDQGIGLCDMDLIQSLRCYSDDELGFYSTGIRDSCTYQYTPLSIDSKTIPCIKLYPNPISGDLHIQRESSGTVQYQIYDLNGRLLKSGFESDIDMRDLSNGMYIIKIRVDNYILIKKIIKHMP